ncbi:hypothetical protein BRC75_09885 [Halobacteriales archaeon QH_7_69_31]|nr:MAG: hypothetical protein BRC75_09885 [Halobacteriales archaeon QH_7_69_31]
MVAAVALIGLALFGAAPAAAQEDDDIPDGAESTLNETQTAGPVTVDPLVNESGDDERVGFEDSGVDAAGQSAGAEFVVEVDDDGPFYAASVDDIGAGGNVAGVNFGAGVGAGAAQGCSFTAAGAGAGGGYSGVPILGEFGEGAGAGDVVNYPGFVNETTCEADDQVPEN